jgi:small subunit ribosomal protein S6
MDVRHYELMYIVRPDLAEEQFNAVSERVDSIIGNLGGKVIEKNVWGKRRLAYPIDDHEEGYYVVEQVDLAPPSVQELENQLRISDDVIRHIVVRPGE